MFKFKIAIQAEKADQVLSLVEEWNERSKEVNSDGKQKYSPLLRTTLSEFLTTEFIDGETVRRRMWFLEGGSEDLSLTQISGEFYTFRPTENAFLQWLGAKGVFAQSWM